MNPYDIIPLFCEYRNVSEESVLGRVRSSKVWYTRYMIWHYVHCKMGLPTSVLVEIFNRNRPSVFRGIRLLKFQLKHDKSLKAEYDLIIKKIERRLGNPHSESVLDNISLS